jgi:hypothetical protein
MALLKKYRIALLVALLVGTITAGASAHRFFGFPFFFFWRQPAPQLEEGTEFLLETDRGLLYIVCFDGTGPAMRTRIELDDALGSARVENGELVFDEIEVMGDNGTGTTTVTINLVPAALNPTFFGSYFSTQGTAEVDDGVNPPTTHNVSLSGFVTTRFGRPATIRSTLRGFDHTTDTATPPKTTLTLLRINVAGTEVDIEIPTPMLP